MKKQNLDPIRDYLDTHYTEKVSLDALADQFFISKFYLTRVFKEQFGVSINTYVLNLRITKAKQMLRAHPEYLGERHKGENTLPILIKFIDAKKDLSVQVHPTDAFAQEHENGQLGKTEMWYVLDASKDAKLVYGLKQDCTKEEIRKAIANGTVMKYLQKVPIHKAEIK